MNDYNPSAFPHVRPAVMGDLTDLMQLGREAFAENGLMELDEDIIHEAALRAIKGDDAVAGVIGPVGSLQGAVHLCFAKFWYTRHNHLEELWTYVRPAYRKSKNAKALLKFAKDLAVQLNTPLFAGVLSSAHTEAKIALYKRQFGAPAGAFFLYNRK